MNRPVCACVRVVGIRLTVVSQCACDSYGTGVKFPVYCLQTSLLDHSGETSVIVGQHNITLTQLSTLVSCPKIVRVGFYSLSINVFVKISLKYI